MEIGWVVLVVAAIVLVLVIPVITLRVLAASLERRVAAAFPANEIVLQDLRAITFGQESRGLLQGRGNGALVLTRNELWFSRALPRRDLRIPLDAVTEVATVKSHLGKTYLRDLLRVSFRSGATTDAVAWFVTDVPAWRAKLEEMSVGRAAP